MTGLQVDEEVRHGEVLSEHIKSVEEDCIGEKVRIQRLLALSQPITPDMTFIRMQDEKEMKSRALQDEEEDDSIGPWQDLDKWLGRMERKEKDRGVLGLLRSMLFAY